MQPPAHLASAVEEILMEPGILAFHCTRLLGTEAADIRANGIRPATDGLIKEKLDRAVGEGHLTAEE
jgi:hypothetical protein